MIRGSIKYDRKKHIFLPRYKTHLFGRWEYTDKTWACDGSEIRFGYDSYKEAKERLIEVLKSKRVNFIFAE